MTEGVVTGGWGFVWAAYAVTVIGFLMYGVMLVTKLREDQSRTAGQGDQE